MKSSGLTTMEIKRINKTNVYQYIYQNRRVSKQQISSSLSMGLTTVTQNLKLLEAEGLIQKKGCFQSTGGRKARGLEVVSNFRLSIGIEILKDKIHFVQINLYGEILSSETFPTPFSSSPTYCKKLGEHLEDFIKRHISRPERILGVSLALQGIISKDGASVAYGKILNGTELGLKDFQAYIPYPCRLEHDSKAAAALEIWRNPELSDSIVLLLNENLGSAVVLNGKIQHGLHSHSGTLEHMCLDSRGPSCYCGKKGCLETYCSAESLKNACQEDLELFFQKLRRGAKKETLLWENYLSCLALAMRNFLTALDLPVVLSGYLSPFLLLEDLERLYDILEEISPFPFSRDFLHISSHGRLSPAAGAALYEIDRFLSEI